MTHKLTASINVSCSAISQGSKSRRPLASEKNELPSLELSVNDDDGDGNGE